MSAFRVWNSLNYSGIWRIFSANVLIWHLEVPLYFLLIKQESFMQELLKAF